MTRHATSAARRRTTILAGHTGDEDAARTALGDDDAAVREAALGALARLDRVTPDDLERGATDRDPLVRRRTAEVTPAVAPLLGPSHPSGDLLARLLRDPDALVVEAAAFASGERRPAEAGAVDALIAIAHGHDDPLCREAAVAALGAIGDPSAVPTILAALDDKPPIRRRAIIALAPFGGPEVDRALRRARDDRDRQVRQAAEDLLGR